MKHHYLIFIFTFCSTFLVSSQEPATLYLEVEDVSVDCSSDGCTDITASFLTTFSTDSYTIESIDYNPPIPYHGLSNQLNPDADDSWSEIANLSFAFCFFDTIETQFQLGSNGVLRFEVDPTDTGPGSNGWMFDEDLPNNDNQTLGDVNVFLPLHDIDPNLSELEEIGYEVFGSTPNRMFVVSYFGVPLYGTTTSGCNILRATQMAVFYESSNVIDFYIKDKPICPDWNDGNAALGIQNNDGDVAFVPPGRNTSDSPWETYDEAWRFKPSGANAAYVFEWLNASGDVISNDPTINVCVTEPTTYTAKITYTNCNGDEVILTDDIIVTVEGNPVPVTPTPLMVCDDDNDGITDFILSDKDFEIIGGEPDVTITYHETFDDATNGILQLATPFANTTPFSQIVYARVENIITACFTIVELKLSVNEIPLIGVISDYVQIDIGNDGVEFFDLTNKIPEILNGQTEITVTFFETVSDANNDENSIVDPAIYQNISNPQTIYVRLENDNTSCFSIGNFDLIVDTTAGVEEDNLIDFSMLPNPASETIQIQSSNFSSETYVEVFNIQGQVVFSEVKNSATGNFTVNVSDLASGMYFIQIQSEGNTIAKKLIKK